MCGRWATADRPALSALLLTLALWTHGDALFFVAPVTVLITQRRWLVVPIASYAVWLVTIGGSSIRPMDDGPTAEVCDAAHRIHRGRRGRLRRDSRARHCGDGPRRATGAARDPSRFVVAGLVGFASVVLILTIGRAQFGPDQAEAPRYIYAALPFVLMTLTGIRAVPRPVWAAGLVLAIALNVWALPRGVAIYQAFLAYDRSITLDQRLMPFVLNGSLEP